MDKFSNNKRYDKDCEILDDVSEDAFQYTVFVKVHSRLKSTNPIERLNKEIRKRENVACIFPNIDSATHLIRTLLMDILEEWNG